MQITFYNPVRSSFEYSSRLTCPGSMGPPLCLAELEREAGGLQAPRLVWGDTGEGRQAAGSICIFSIWSIML